jgi:hypothetical protein
MTRLSIALICTLTACENLYVWSTPDDSVCFETPENQASACPTDASPMGYRMVGPDVMLLVDRSGSMLGEKWDALQQMRPFLPAVSDRANLGLSMFPSYGGLCNTVDLEFAPISSGPGAAEEVSDALATYVPTKGKTPLGSALRAVKESSGLQCTNRDNIVVLLSDGAESCGGDPVEAAYELTHGPVPVELYVIGFGTDAEATRHLQEVAAAAEDTSGPDNYYAAENVEDLLARLYAVTGTCTVQLDETVAAADLVVSMDGHDLERCDETPCATGYTYDEGTATVELGDVECRSLHDGECHDLSFDAA